MANDQSSEASDRLGTVHSFVFSDSDLARIRLAAHVRGYGNAWQRWVHDCLRIMADDVIEIERHKPTHGHEIT